MGKNVINIDAIPGLTDPLELTVGGRKFVIANMKKETLDRVTEIGENEESATSVVDVLSDQINLLVGGAEEDLAFFRTLDARVLRATLSRVMEALTEAGERKSGSKNIRR